MSIPIRSIRIIYAILACVICININGCMQGNAATSVNKPQKPITDNTLKIVNAAFYSTFILGEWRYKGARNRGGSINAYIKIPAPLEMSKEAQKSYLQKAICPSSSNISMWNEVENIPLSVHIYTHKQKHSLHVDCINPLITG
ncbi:hypothetical protein [uncultured Paraglaciecola sp.]|uniref:hypothetical protein n=1 Tax=uncultured Paraglaciecola sp. TaxID=1765024 RepID=UPI0026203192|nr:hypothetical protein [uncultured Paraglaciecola sp.]